MDNRWKGNENNKRFSQRKWKKNVKSFKNEKERFPKRIQLNRKSCFFLRDSTTPKELGSNYLSRNIQ